MTTHERTASRPVSARCLRLAAKAADAAGAAAALNEAFGKTAVELVVWATEAV